MNERVRNDILAAEYVMGTLRGPARRRFASMMEQDPILAAKVSSWQEAFEELDAADAPVQPPGRVWRAIQLRLPPGFSEVANQGMTEPTPVKPRIAGLNTHGFIHRWQFASLALAASLIAVLLWPRFLVQDGKITGLLPVAVLASTQAGSGQQMIISVDPSKRTLIVTPLNPAARETGHSLELWLIAEGQKPSSLGLIEAEGITVMDASKFQLKSGTILAVSREPAGGSPTGQPTGAVLYAGKLNNI